ncbi:unnamed protein product [Arctogadus glacialis]
MSRGPQQVQGLSTRPGALSKSRVPQQVQGLSTRPGAPSKSRVRQQTRGQHFLPERQRCRSHRLGPGIKGFSCGIQGKHRLKTKIRAELGGLVRAQKSQGSVGWHGGDLIVHRAPDGENGRKRAVPVCYSDGAPFNSTECRRRGSGRNGQQTARR